MEEKNKDKLDFEISFYEELLEKRPDFVDALILLGELYTKKGLYSNGLSVDRRLAQLRPDEPVVHYNLACSYSLLNKTDEALASLKRAVQLGYTEFDFMEGDKDLNNIRQDQRYKELVSRYKRIT